MHRDDPKSAGPLRFVTLRIWRSEIRESYAPRRSETLKLRLRCLILSKCGEMVLSSNVVWCTTWLVGWGRME